jgi:hypothetical protein
LELFGGITTGSGGSIDTTETGIINFGDTGTRTVLTGTASANRAISFPDASGTIAITSDITGTNSGTNTGDQTTIAGITGTIAQFNTALTDGDFATLAGTETITNKTLTSPTLTTPALGTPASGALTNCTSIPSAQLTGDVAVARIATALTTPGAIGGTTPSTGAFTTISATGVTTISAGTAAAPGLCISGDTNTGVFSAFGDSLDFTTGGVGRMNVLNSSINSLVQHRFTGATAAALAVSGASDTNTGVYFAGSDVFGIATNGLARWTITATGELAADATNGGGLTLTKTITAVATTGAQTINKSSGRVNFAAAATSLVVTNSLCTVNSIIHVTIATNDTTADLVRVVAAAGSFTIHMRTAPTAETAVNWLLTN